MAEKVQIIIEAKDQASGVIKGIGNAFSGVGSVIAGIMGSQLITGALSAVQDFAVGSISAASDLNETLSKTNTLFGEGAAEIIKWSEGAAAAAGQSQTAALDAAGMFAIFGKAAGLAGQDLNDFATENVQLAADMASFFNTSVEDASVALQAAFRGETEPIRRYGVMLDDATMRQKALEMGIISTTKQALTPQQKVLAANALIFDQTAAAQGDFARTSDGLANSQRILKAQLENSQTQLGTIFLPIVTQIVGALNTQFIPAVNNVISFIRDMATTFQETTGWGAEWKDLILSLFPPEFQDDAMEAMFWIDLAIESFANLYNAIAPVALVVWQNLKPAFDATASTLQYIAGEVLTLFLGMMDSLTVWFVENAPLIDAFTKMLADAWISYVLPAIETAWNVIQPILSGLFDIILQIGTLIMQVATGDWQGAWNTIVSIVQTAGAALWAAFVALFDGVTKIMGTSIEQVSAQWRNGINGMVTLIRSKISAFIQSGKDLMTGFLTGIMENASAIIDYITGLAEDIIAGINAALGIQSPSKVFYGIGKNLMVGMANGITSAAGMVDTALSGAMQPTFAMAGAGVSTSYTTNNSRQSTNYYGPVTVMNEARNPNQRLLKDMR